MTITVVDSKKVWESPDGGKVKIWDVTLDNGTTLQTKSEKIAAGGTFEVETYEKGTNTYIRQVAKEQSSYEPRAQSSSSAADKRFVADPLKQESIEWQSSLAQAVTAVRDYHSIFRSPEGVEGHRLTLADYKKQIVDTLITFHQAISVKPTEIAKIEPASLNEMIDAIDWSDQS